VLVADDAESGGGPIDRSIDQPLFDREELVSAEATILEGDRHRASVAADEGRPDIVRVLVGDENHARVREEPVGEPLKRPTVDGDASREAIAERLDDVAADERRVVRRQSVGPKQLVRQRGDEQHTGCGHQVLATSQMTSAVAATAAEA
jgi:hypothetical protein